MTSSSSLVHAKPDCPGSIGPEHSSEAKVWPKIEIAKKNLSIRGGTSLDARLGSARLERFLSRLERLEARNSKSSQSSARLELEKTACEYSIVKMVNF